MSKRSRRTLVLIDGHSLVHRAYHAIPPLFSTSRGEPTNAVYGFTSMLLKVLNDVRPDCLAVAFDRSAPTYRHQQYANYKATRPRVADELRLQFGRVREVIEAFGVPIYEVDGFEADDVLGALARQAAKHGVDSIIVTGDLDALQLVDEHCTVLAARGRVSGTVVYDVPAVRERYGLDPAQIADLKALAGDASDNIQGVRGIGVKTAAKLLTEYGTIDSLYDHLEDVPARLRDTLASHEQRARQSKELATIRTDAPCVLDVKRCRVDKFDRARVLALFRELEFKSLVPKLAAAADGPLTEVEPRPGPGQLSLFASPTLTSSRSRRKMERSHPPKESPAPHHVPRKEGRRKGKAAPLLVTDPAALPSLVRQLRAAGTVVLHPVLESRSSIEFDLVGLAYATARAAGYVPVSSGSADGVNEALLLESIVPLLSDESVAKVGHDLKRLYGYLGPRGFALEGYALDTAISSYLLNPASRAVTVKDLVFGHLGREIADVAAVAPKGASLANAAPAVVGEVAAEEARLLLEIAEVLKKELAAREQLKLLEQVEMPLVPVLAKMERAGVAIDVDILRQMGRDLGKQISRVEREAHECVGHEFNIASPQQLGRLLAEGLRLPLTRRTKTGWSTDQSVLEELIGSHPVIEKVLEYRQLAKLKSTYVDALPVLINPRTGRLHTTFNQMVAATGRLSSSEPNLQNIPIRTELGRKIRRAFIAGRPDTVLLTADYAQIDLRILAHISQDPLLIQTFRDGTDVHTATAALLFNIGAEAVTAEQRRLAKTANFAILYGISDWGLSQRTGMTRQEAGPFISTYLGRYNGVRRYMDRTLQMAREMGYVETLWRRRRYLPELRSPHRPLQQAAERMAINHPVQGTQADLIKLAMNAIHQELEAQGFAAQMILQVHDELVFEVPRGEVAALAPRVRSLMESALQLDVPIVVEMKTGANWYELESYAGTARG